MRSSMHIILYQCEICILLLSELLSYQSRVTLLWESATHCQFLR